jgi:two-component system nitrate/nitrite response regulator NarL
MRVLVCDDHVVFAESLAYLLTSMGHEVVGVTHRPNQAIPVLRRGDVDICLLDVTFGADTVLPSLADLRNAAPRTRVVLLTGRVDPSVINAARLAGVRGIADKRMPAAEIMTIIRRVHAGEVVLPDAGRLSHPVRVTRSNPANDTQRLAGFLTARERQVVSALVRGEDTARLAKRLGISVATARSHIQSVLTKMGAHSRLEAATSAVRHGMVNPATGDWLIHTG